MRAFRPAFLVAMSVLLTLATGCAPDGPTRGARGDSPGAEPSASQASRSRLAEACAGTVSVFNRLSSALHPDVTVKSLGSDATQLAMMTGVLAANIDHFRQAARETEVAGVWIDRLDAARGAFVLAVRAARHGDVAEYRKYRGAGLGSVAEASAHTPPEGAPECEFSRHGK